MAADRFVSEVIGPNMTLQRDWAEELMLKGALPIRSHLPERVRKRLGWQAVSEFTYLSHRGATWTASAKPRWLPASWWCSALRTRCCRYCVSSSVHNVWTPN